VYMYILHVKNTIEDKQDGVSLYPMHTFTPSSSQTVTPSLIALASIVHMVLAM